MLQIKRFKITKTDENFMATPMLPRFHLTDYVERNEATGGLGKSPAADRLTPAANETKPMGAWVRLGGLQNTLRSETKRSQIWSGRGSSLYPHRVSAPSRDDSLRSGLHSVDPRDETKPVGVWVRPESTRNDRAGSRTKSIGMCQWSLAIRLERRRRSNRTQPASEVNHTNPTRKFWCCAFLRIFFALKGRNRTARGNAPGKRDARKALPCKGRTVRAKATIDEYVLPFEGERRWSRFETQGVALGYPVPAFQAENARTLQTAQHQNAQTRVPAAISFACVARPCGRPIRASPPQIRPAPESLGAPGR